MPAPASAAKNLLFCYLYRDGGNNKRYHEVVIPGLPADLDEFQQAIIQTLDEQLYFVAEQINLPSAAHYRNGGAVSHLDHTWHEVSGVEATDAEPSGPFKSPEDLLVAFQTASREGWKALPLPEAS